MSLYSDMLRESLNEILTTTTNRVVAAVTQHQFQSNESLEEATHTVVGELAAAVGSHQAALMVTTTAGEQLMAIGNTDLLPPIDNEEQLDRLVVASSDVNGVMAVVVARGTPAIHGLRARDRPGCGVRPASQAARRPPAIAGGRAPTPVSSGRHPVRPARRRRGRAGQQASVIVVAVDGTGLRPGLMQTWLGQIRLQLREGDFAGILSDRRWQSCCVAHPQIKPPWCPRD